MLESILDEDIKGGEFHRDKLEGQQIFNPQERVEGRSEPSAQVHSGGGVSKH